MRLFMAINFNNDTRSRLLSLRDELRSHAERGNFSLPENLHLTLVFLGECSAGQSSAIKSVMDKVVFEPFDIQVERVGRFKRDDPHRASGDTWWAGLHGSKPLLDLQQTLTDKLTAEGFSLDKREYKPHITLGREVVTDAVPWKMDPFGERVGQVDLMKSERMNGKLTYTSIYRRGNCLRGSKSAADEYGKLQQHE